MSERGFTGLEVRTVEGDVVGRISDVLTDEASGAVTHVLVERGEERFEIPVTAITLEPEVDFVTFHPDRPGVEPEDRAGEAAGGRRHEGQFAGEPASPAEAQAPEDLVREDWEDETHTPPESGYPRNDAYIDPETGEEEVAPHMREVEDLEDEISLLVDGTGVEVRSVRDGVVELSGSVGSGEDLRELVDEIRALSGVREVDTTDVSRG